MVGFSSFGKNKAGLHSLGSWGAGEGGGSRDWQRCSVLALHLESCISGCEMLRFTEDRQLPALKELII